MTITSDLSTLHEVWLDRIPIERAVRAGTVAFAGPPALTRRMPSVLRVSPIAPVVGAADR